MPGPRRLVFLCLLGIAFNALVFGPSLRLTAAGKTDFINFYAGGRLAFTGEMYRVDNNLRVQRESTGWDNTNRLFNRPPFMALLLWPMARLSYASAVRLWAALTIAAIAAFCWLWPGDRKTTLLACCWSLPLFYVLADGQDVAILLVIVAVAWRALKSGRDSVAGLLFSLCAMKFHLFLLLPVFILGQKRWKFLAGLAAGGMGLVLLSFLAGGAEWPAAYLAFLRNPIGNPWPTAMPTLHGLTNGWERADLWQVVGTTSVAMATWFAVRRGGLEYGLAAVLAGGIVIAPHAYLADCAMAIPALLLTLPMAVAPWQRMYHVFLLSPLIPIWILMNPAWPMAVALIAYVAWLATRSAAVPLYTQGIYPFTNHPMLVPLSSERITSN